MSLTVNQRPSTTISGETSRWNAIAHPLIYKMQRKDFTFASITNSGGFVRLVIDASFGNVASSFTVDDVVYFQTDAGVYAVTGTVTASSYSAPNTLVTLDTAYISSSTGWVNNDDLRPSYAVDVNVYNGSGTLLTTDSLRFQPDDAGLVYIDIREIIRAQLVADISANLTAGTKVFDDTNAYLKFYIKYTEVWTGSAETQTNDSSNQFYAVLGANQIPSTYGSNLALHVTFSDGGPVGSFLNRMSDMVFWRGYPCLLSAIVGDNISGNVFLQVGVSASTPAAYQGKLLAFDLNEILATQTVDSVDVKLYRDDTVDVLLSETLTVELRDPCSNPVYLMGRNSKGGVLQWMFDHSQESSFDFSEKKTKRQMLFAENLTATQWDALNDFFQIGETYRNNIVEFTSSTIKTQSRIGSQVYVVDSSGNKIGVTVIPRANMTKTHHQKHVFAIEIEYPETFSA